MSGWLGCPVCGSRYVVRDGVALFGVEWPAATGAAPDPVRLAALLDLAEPGGLAMLAGRYALAAAEVARLCELQLVVLGAGGPGSGPASVLQTGTVLPLRDAVLRAAAVDEVAASRVRLEEFVRALRPGWRLLAQSSLALPGGVRQLARDDVEWVAERSGPVVRLGRAAKASGA
ncbi:MAG: hypothetical protein K6T27_09515 [Thermoleophilum sp.]|nr:hypothetical protein [Thermoleophilum sp.]